MKIKSLLLCSLLAFSPMHVRALEFTLHATSDDYINTGRLFFTFSLYAKNPELCKSYPTPRTNKAKQELNSLIANLKQHQHEKWVLQGFQMGAMVLHDDTGSPMTKSECNAVDEEIGKFWKDLLVAWKEAGRVQ